MPSDWRRTGLPQLIALLNHACLEAGAMLALRAPSLVPRSITCSPTPRTYNSRK